MTTDRLRSGGLAKAVRYGSALVGLLAIAVFAGASLGAESVSLFDLNAASSSILFDIRLPRVLLGACVGASLAVAGAGLQALLRNPLAEPYLLGVSNGAALGTWGGAAASVRAQGSRP